jgi:hypothetical protein
MSLIPNAPTGRSHSSLLNFSDLFSLKSVPHVARTGGRGELKEEGKREKRNNAEK